MAEITQEAIEQENQEYDLVGNIIAWEMGNLVGREQLDFFCYLLNNKLMGALQGTYVRYAQSLLDQGLIQQESDSGGKYLPQYQRLDEGPV